MTYTVSSGTLNSSIPYHTLAILELGSVHARFHTYVNPAIAVQCVEMCVCVW